MFRLLTALLAFTMLASITHADSVYGTCRYNDGSKVDGTVTIATSWNSQKAFPKAGKYEINFGRTVGKKITIYVNGNKYTTIYVNGRTELNIKVPK